MTLNPLEPRTTHARGARTSTPANLQADRQTNRQGTMQGAAAGVLVRDPHRDLGLEQVARVLQDQQARQLDVITGAGAIRCLGGRLVVSGLEPQLGPDGVTMSDGVYALNDIAVEQIADKLKIPLAYLRRTAVQHPDLFDANINGWLEREERRFLIRALRYPTPTSSTGSTGSLVSPGSGVDGMARAFLSDRFATIDNLDVLMAALEGIRASGHQVEIEGCSLTERRMHVRVNAPAVQALAPVLLRDYRSPFDGRRGIDLPIVSAGFVITNSETGCGAFSITPRLSVLACRNGLIVDVADQDKIRRTHLGSQYDGDDGVVTRSTETLGKVLELISARSKDAVATYLDPAFLTEQIRRLERLAGTPIEDPDTTIKVVSQKLRFTEDQQAAILTHFIRGADTTAGGLMHAVTSVAQTLTDPDDAHDMESVALQAMRLAAAQ